MLKSLLRPWVQRMRRFRHRLQGPPRYAAIPTLAALGVVQPRVVLDRARVVAGGWLTPAEESALYSLGRWAPGPFLEIGPWIGRSTTILALGIADSGSEKEFTTREINPTLANYRPTSGDWIGFFLPAESTESMGQCSRESVERDIAPVVSRPGGIVGQLRTNLARAGVDHLVRISVGDFRQLESKPHRFVFTDAMHDEVEITRNAPELRRFLAPGSILACHDTSNSNLRLLHQYFEFGDSFRADSLFVGEIRRLESDPTSPR